MTLLCFYFHVLSLTSQRRRNDAIRRAFTRITLRINLVDFPSTMFYTKTQTQCFLEPQRQKTYLRTSAPSKGSEQLAHSILDSQGFKFSACGQRRLQLDCAYSQADLSLF